MTCGRSSTPPSLIPVLAQVPPFHPPCPPCAAKFLVGVRGDVRGPRGTRGRLNRAAIYPERTGTDERVCLAGEETGKPGVASVACGPWRIVRRRARMPLPTASLNACDRCPPLNAQTLSSLVLREAGPTRRCLLLMWARAGRRFLLRDYEAVCSLAARCSFRSSKDNADITAPLCLVLHGPWDCSCDCFETPRGRARPSERLRGSHGRPRAAMHRCMPLGRRTSLLPIDTPRTHHADPFFQTLPRPLPLHFYRFNLHVSFLTRKLENGRQLGLVHTHTSVSNDDFCVMRARGCNWAAAAICGTHDVSLAFDTG